MNTANKLTIFRILLVPLFVYLLYCQTAVMRYWALAVFIIAAITDFVDGYVARNYDQITNLGKLLDPVADKILVVSALIAFVDLSEIPGWIVIVIISRDFFVDVLRMNAAAQGIVLAAGKWGKLKTVVQMVAIILILANNYPAVMINLPLDQITLYLAVFLTVLSGAEYTVANWRKLNL
ncbi:MAG: CDP-diacylglycerol--glycerol-3-phosphate 3-phosphatidyltransferase [Clostridiales bacterium]|nr:MAG: CDP-diacylglycerol--glycerol-3-phosphate 3-phosphatidyltransferase [Clostridiales bacterium]